MGFRQDYILRLIEQLAAAIRRIAGLRRKGDFVAAREAVEVEWEKLLGLSHELVHVVDTPTLAGMLKEPAKMRIAAQLLAEEARTFAESGDPIHATLRRKMALELVIEARAIDPDDPADDLMMIELAGTVQANELDPRYVDD